jgi:UvrD/REP helicase N-terminal domain
MAVEELILPLSQEEFLRLIPAAQSSSLGEIYPPDEEQADAVYAPAEANLFIVAGPGTGKTSCLSYRALYLVLVCG